MDFEVTVPDLDTMVTAAEDCGEARKDWRMRAAAIVGDDKAIQAQNDVDSGKYRDAATTTAAASSGRGIQVPGGGRGIQMPR